MNLANACCLTTSEAAYIPETLRRFALSMSMPDSQCERLLFTSSTLRQMFATQVWQASKRDARAQEVRQ